MDVLFSIFIATYAVSGAQFCNLAELPQAQSIEVVRIYVQQMIGRNEWGQGIILKPTCGGRMAASPSPVVCR